VARNNNAHFKPPALVPALLALNKQTNVEARTILYANEFVFSDTFALYNFLINLGPSGSTHLKHLRLINWGYSRVMKAYNHSCFVALVWATKLETLHVEHIYGYYINVNRAAEQLYRDAFPWLEVVGAAKGKLDAAVDILRIEPELFTVPQWYGTKRQEITGDGQLVLYKERLSKMLGAHQERIMGDGGGKKRKVVRDEL
jgi:hypothetical protein